jgi:hypothetical protein
VEKKRLVIDLEEEAHGKLMEEARSRNMTLANYVRQALQLPLGRQGVRPDPMQIVRPTIEDVPEFYLMQRLASFQVWLPAPAGGPMHLLTPSPRLTKSAYVSSFEVSSNNLRTAYNELGGEYPLLLLDVPHSFGPPYRAVRIFSARVSPPTFQNAVTYLATTSRAPYKWINDITQLRQPGFLLFGIPNGADLWQIIYCEPDPADRCIFVLSAVRLPHGLPRPDFTKIADATLQAEAQQHWSNVEQALIAHNSYGLVNSASSLSEALLRAFLHSPGGHSRSFAQMLDTLKTELDSGNSVFSPIDYHFMQIIRNMHQSTQHPARVVSNGRAVGPRLALSLAEGMVEVLASLGLVRQ